MLTTLTLTSKNPFNALNSGVEKHVPCGDVSHYQPLFFPTACHHPNKVIVANLEEGMGTLVHAGSKRNPAFGLWPLRQELVRAVKSELERRNGVDGELASSEMEKEVEEAVQNEQVEDVSQNEKGGVSLAEFLGNGNDDSEWEIVPSPKDVREKFVLVGKRVVA